MGLEQESTSGLLGSPASAIVVDEKSTSEPSFEQYQHFGEDESNHMDRDQDGAFGQGLGDFEIKEQDRWLPIANVARIMKTALSEHAKITKEAKQCMQECVSEFISFITSEAIEKNQQEKQKTLNGEDLLFSMNSLGFENYAEALKVYLSRYREVSSTITSKEYYRIITKSNQTQSPREENQNNSISSGCGH